MGAKYTGQRMALGIIVQSVGKRSYQDYIGLIALIAVGMW